MMSGFELKLEVNSMEQTYKFNEDDNLRSMKDVEKVVDETFLTECLKCFSEMNRSIGMKRISEILFNYASYSR